jgi:hypothetical protein
MRKIQFIRWGNLNPHKQDSYGCDSFHSAPARKGLYAFPVGFVEPFLLSGCNFTPERHEWLKDSEGNLIGVDHPLWDANGSSFIKLGGHLDPWEDKFSQERERMDAEGKTFKEKSEFYNSLRYMAKVKPAKHFYYTGLIWTHLDCKKIMPEKVVGAWNLHTYKDYVKLVQKAYAQHKAYKTANGYGYNYDHMEVFIERLK